MSPCARKSIIYMYVIIYTNTLSLSLSFIYRFSRPTNFIQWNIENSILFTQWFETFVKNYYILIWKITLNKKHRPLNKWMNTIEHNFEFRGTTNLVKIGQIRHTKKCVCMLRVYIWVWCETIFNVNMWTNRLMKTFNSSHGIDINKYMHVVNQKNAEVKS